MYRLYHQAFADHLRRPEQESNAQQKITRALLAHVPLRSDGEGRDWRLAHPYVRTHLATHAAAGGLLEKLLEDAWYLIIASPDRLLRVLRQVTSQSARQEAEVYERAAHHLLPGAYDTNVSYLELVARCNGADDLAYRLATLKLDRPWSVPWARWQTSHPHRVLGRHEDEVTVVTLGKLDGQAVVVSGSYDETVRRWELTTGAPIGDPVTHDGGWVNALAVGELNGQPVVVSASSFDRAVRRWELATGVPIGDPVTHDGGWVNVLAVGELNGQPVVVSGGQDRYCIAGN